MTNWSFFFFPGWGEIPSVQPKSDPAWGEPAAPTSAVDNGTSAWGKPPGGVGGWGDGVHEPSGPYGRGSGLPGPAPCKPGNTQKSLMFAGTAMLHVNNKSSASSGIDNVMFSSITY